MIIKFPIQVKMTAASMLIVGTIISVLSSNVPYAVATQSVDEEACNHLGLNPGGNFHGNTHCLLDPPTNQPVRDCDSPNALKDNDGDNVSACRN
jgi:hypothetical protein